MSGRPDDPTRIGRALEEYLERAGLAERVEEAAVVPEWEDRVGPAIAAVTTPLRVSNGVLFVAVRSSVWLMELQMMEREILGRLNDGRPRDEWKIKKIRFFMGRD